MFFSAAPLYSTPLSLSQVKGILMHCTTVAAGSTFESSSLHHHITSIYTATILYFI